MTFRDLCSIGLANTVPEVFDGLHRTAAFPPSGGAARFASRVSRNVGTLGYSAVVVIYMTVFGFIQF